mgnify:CR=1 FL=1
MKRLLKKIKNRPRFLTIETEPNRLKKAELEPNRCRLLSETISSCMDNVNLVQPTMHVIILFFPHSF